MVNQQNEKYRSLRDQARQEGSEMARCFDEAHNAHERGDGAQAKHLSEEGHRHQREMERLNGQASDWIFRGDYFLHANVLILTDLFERK